MTAAPSAPAVELADVTVELGGTRALEAASMSIEAGRFVGLVGPNGAGKTTLLRAVNGRLTPDAGTVRVEGRDVGELSAREIGRLVATVPQRTELSFAFPVRAIVEMGRFPHRSRLGWDDPGSDRIAWAMDRTGISHLADRPVTETSGGERQRVLLARALAQDAPVLALDEPTASLDVNHQVRTLSLVRELVDEGDRTAIAAIHDLDLAARFCDELVLLADGRIRTTGLPASVLSAAGVEAAFDTTAAIGQNPVTGSTTVTALPDAPDEDSAPGRIHVVGGGGRAAPLLHRLVAAGYDVTVGAIHDDDPDRVAAEALDLPTATVPPFTSVETAIDEARDLARAADVTVLADVAIGPTNAENLAVAEAADRLVVVEERPFEARNHAGETVAARYAALVETATVVDAVAVPAAVAAEVEAARRIAADGGS